MGVIQSSDLRLCNDADFNFSSRAELPACSVRAFMAAFQHICEITAPKGSGRLCGCNLHVVYVYAVLWLPLIQIEYVQTLIFARRVTPFKTLLFSPRSLLVHNRVMWSIFSGSILLILSPTFRTMWCTGSVSWERSVTARHCWAGLHSFDIIFNFDQLDRSAFVSLLDISMTCFSLNIITS